MVEDIIRNKSELLNRSRVKALCLTIPGTFSLQDNNFSSSVLQVKTPADFVNKIKDCLDIPVLVGNESSSLAYAEKCHVGKSMDDLLFVNICSGVGAGIIINDKLFTGTGGLAGEIGHISINYGGRPCFCGNRGCLERYVNLNAIMDSILRELRNGTDSLLPKMCNNDYSKINFDMLRIANENGDSLVHNMLEIAASRLTLGISNMICALSCYSIVLGGGIEKLGPSFLYMVRHEIATSGFRKVMNKVSVRYATAQNDAECLGVAEYFIDNIFEIMDKARDEVGVV